MADLDNRSKRASSVHLGQPWSTALVLPDGTIDQGDRQHIAFAYSGIAAAVLIVVVVTDIVYGNLTPTAEVEGNLTPTAEVEGNLTPTAEVKGI